MNYKLTISELQVNYKWTMSGLWSHWWTSMWIIFMWSCVNIGIYDMPNILPLGLGQCKIWGHASSCLCCQTNYNATSIGQISRCSTHREIHVGIQPFKNIQMKCRGFMWKIVMPQLDLNGVSIRMHLVTSTLVENMK